MTELTPEQRRALVGEPGSPGLLDQYKIAGRILNDRPVVTWHCPRRHGENTGHVGVIARNLDGDQTGLTLGELVEAALDHEAEAH